NGVYATTANGELLLVATDGRRLHRVALKGMEWPGAGAILPTGALVAVEEVLREDGEIRIGAGQRVDISAGARRLSTKTIQGTYPNFRQVVPSVSSRIARVSGIEGKAMVEAIG